MINPKINLYEFEGLGLILKSPTGLYYSNQVAGYGCKHPVIQGYFIPIPEGEKREEQSELGKVFDGNWHSLAEESAKKLDNIFSKYEYLKFMHVDRNLLDQSYEAWIHVNIDLDILPNAGDSDLALISNVKLNTGVLTWLNSD